MYNFNYSFCLSLLLWFLPVSCIAMPRGGGKNAGKKGNESTECLCADSFAMNFLEALDDPSVATKLRKLLSPDYDHLADVVAAKLSVRLKKLENELKEKDETITSLTKRLQEVEHKLDDTEQYSRRTSIRIAGVPEDATEDDVVDKVTRIFDAMKVKPTINRVHRVGPRNNTRARGPRPILCQFTTYPDKRVVMQSKKDIKNSYPDVYINEDLTRKRARIYFIARKLKKQGIFTEVWTADGRICVKDQKGKIQYLTRLHELDRFDAHNSRFLEQQASSASALPQDSGSPEQSNSSVQAPVVNPHN